MTDVTTDVSGRVAVVQVWRGPNNFFDAELLAELSRAVHEQDRRPEVRCVVLCSEGRNFCAGAQLGETTPASIRETYRHGFELLTGRLPIVAAVQGKAVGGGVGLALTADLRVMGSTASMAASFSRLGFHHGFGLSATLPALVGRQRALELLYTGRSVAADEALAIGLCDRTADDPRAEAIALAEDIATSAPLSVAAIRSTMRRALVADVHAAMEVEAAAQAALLGSDDFAEGIGAARERRPPIFTGA